MVDSPSTSASLHSAWLSLGRRVAVAAGAGVALWALVLDVNPWVASMRGALTLVAVWTLFRLALCVSGWLNDGEDAKHQSP